MTDPHRDKEARSIEQAFLIEEAGKRQRAGQRVEQTVAELQRSLDTLRVSVKYLVFDLEATRRERDHLRKMMGWP